LSEDEVRSLIVGPPGSEVELLVGQSNTGSFLGGLSESHHKVVLTRRLIDFNDISPSPSSVFSQSPGLSPQSSFTASQPQQFAGVGVLLSQDFTSDLCEVKSLNPVGAAALSGRVKIGDRLLKIDGQSLLGQSLIDVSRRIQVRVFPPGPARPKSCSFSDGACFGNFPYLQRPAGSQIRLVLQRPANFSLGGVRDVEEEVELTCQ
jgi:hypothetical protein